MSGRLMYIVASREHLYTSTSLHVSNMFICTCVSPNQTNNITDIATFHKKTERTILYRSPTTRAVGNLALM